MQPGSLLKTVTRRIDLNRDPWLTPMYTVGLIISCQHQQRRGFINEMTWSVLALFEERVHELLLDDNDRNRSWCVL